MRKLLAIVFAALAFNIIFFPFQKNFFGSFMMPNAGTLGFFSFIVAFQVFQYIAFFDNLDVGKKKNVLTLSTISVVTSLMAVFRASQVDIHLFVVLSLISAVLSLYTFCLPRGETIDSLFEVAITPVALFFEGIVGFFTGMKKLNVKEERVVTNSKFSLAKLKDLGILYIILGFFIGIPLVLVITALLSSADPVFSKFVSNIFSFKDFPWWLVQGSIARLVLTSIFLIGAIGSAFTYIKKQHQQPQDIFNDKLAKRKLSYVAVSVVAMVAFVLAAFLVVGFPYLFTNVAETELIKFGVNTLSEYVTKGFTELVVVSVIVYLSSAMAVAVYKLGGRGSQILKWFNILLLSETVVFILSIFRRVSLYQMTHGLTRVRIYGSVFLACLIFLTIILVLRHSKTITKWFWYELSVFAFAAVMIFFLRPDYMIATQYKPTVNKEIDYVYIVRLSPESVDGWIEAYKDAKIKLDNIEAMRNNPVIDFGVKERDAYYTFLTLNILRKNYKDLTLKYGTAAEMWDAKATFGGPQPLPGWKAVNIEEQLAYQKLKANIDIKELISYEEKSYNLYYKSGLIIREQYGVHDGKNMKTKFDRSLESPLVPDVRIDR